MAKSHSKNGIGHFDVAGPDLMALSAFYSDLFGWRIAEKGPGYSLVSTPAGGPDGALVEAETASLTVGIVVPDIEAALETAKNSGGSVAMPTVDNGWVKKAQVLDPAGNRLTLIQG